MVFPDVPALQLVLVLLDSMNGNPRLADGRLGDQVLQDYIGKGLGGMEKELKLGLEPYD